MTETDLLEDVNINTEPASKNLRFVNWLIDFIVYYLLAILIGLIIGLLAPNALNAETRPFNLLSYLISFTLYLSYYTLMEGSTKGKKIGKFITKTRSVREDGSQLTYSDAFKRSLSRLVPFEPFSAFEYRPWHDKWTDTIVIKEI